MTMYRTAVVLLVSLLVTPGGADAARIVVDDVAGARGERRALEVGFVADGDAVAGVEVEVVLPAGARFVGDGSHRPACTFAPESGKQDGGFIFVDPHCITCWHLRALVLSLDDVAPLPESTPLFRCPVEILLHADPASVQVIECRGAEGADPAGGIVGVSCDSAAVRVSDAPPVFTPTAVRTPTPTRTITSTRTITPTATPSTTPTPRPPLPYLEPGTYRAMPGDVVSMEVVLHASGRAVAGVENEIAFASGARVPARPDGRPDCTVEPSIDKSATSFSFQPFGCDPVSSCERVKVIVLSLANLSVIPDGAVLYRCRVEVSPDVAGDALLTLPCTQPRSSDPRGGAIATHCHPGHIIMPAGPTPATPATATPVPPRPTATRTRIPSPIRTPRPPASPLPTLTPRPLPASIDFGQYRSEPGAVVLVEVRLSTQGRQMAGLENEVLSTPGLRVLAKENGRPRCSVESAINKHATAFAFQPSGCDPATDCEGVKAIVLDLANVDPIPDGVIYRCEVQVRDGADPSAIFPLVCGPTRASDPTGRSVPLVCRPGAILMPQAATPTAQAPPTATVAPSATPTRPAPAATRIVSTPAAEDDAAFVLVETLRSTCGTLSGGTLNIRAIVFDAGMHPLDGIPVHFAAEVGELVPEIAVTQRIGAQGGVASSQLILQPEIPVRVDDAGNILPYIVTAKAGSATGSTAFFVVPGRECSPQEGTGTGNGLPATVNLGLTRTTVEPGGLPAGIVATVLDAGGNRVAEALVWIAIEEDSPGGGLLVRHHCSETIIQTCSAESPCPDGESCVRESGTRLAVPSDRAGRAWVDVEATGRGGLLHVTAELPVRTGFGGPCRYADAETCAGSGATLEALPGPTADSGCRVVAGHGGTPSLPYLLLGGALLWVLCSRQREDRGSRTR